MNVEQQIADYYVKARELVKQKQAKAAREYVLRILNCAVSTYNSATTILTKAKTGAFLDRWIAVSRDLYDYGVTDYVMECFGLSMPKPTSKIAVKPKIEKSPTPKEGKPVIKSPDIDYSGLIEDTEQRQKEEEAKMQGWGAEVFAANKSAVVEISVATDKHGACGTGFIISSNGYLLTNDHVVFDEQSGIYYPKVHMSLVGDGKKYKVDVLFSDKKADVALCKFNPNESKGFSVVKRIVDYSKLIQGADCLVLGNAFGMGLAPFAGTVRYTKSKSGNLVYTADSNPGDSGGPVFDRNGQCIGINKCRTVAVNGVAAEGYANATPMDKIEELLKKWTSNNDIKL